jgi:hypothetical protein
VDVGQGKSNLNEGFAELLEYIKGHSLPMKKKSISKGIEDFITHIEEMKDDNPAGFDLPPLRKKSYQKQSTPWLKEAEDMMKFSTQL